MFDFNPLAILSLYDVERSIRPKLTCEKRIHVNSVTSGTSDCIQNVDLSGSSPRERKSHAALKVLIDNFSVLGKDVRA